MNERIVRSILGVLLTKAAILIGWYAYEKYSKEEQSAEKDTSKDVETSNDNVVNDEVNEPVAEEVVKPKRTRKPRVLEMQVETPVEAVKPKRTRKKKPASE